MLVHDRKYYDHTNYVGKFWGYVNIPFHTPFQTAIMKYLYYCYFTATGDYGPLGKELLHSNDR
jgi:hypothetical protein